MPYSPRRVIALRSAVHSAPNRTSTIQNLRSHHCRTIAHSASAAMTPARGTWAVERVHLWKSIYWQLPCIAHHQYLSAGLPSGGFHMTHETHVFASSMSRAASSSRRFCLPASASTLRRREGLLPCRCPLCGLRRGVRLGLPRGLCTELRQGLRSGL